MLLACEAKAGQDYQAAPFEVIFGRDVGELRASCHLPRHAPIRARNPKCRNLGGPLPHNVGHGARAELPR